MLVNTYDSIREQKAKFVRNVEYIKETSIDDIIDERVERAQSKYVSESIEELEEAVSMVNRLNTDDEAVAESTEIQRILDAEENISFNEMVGIE